MLTPLLKECKEQIKEEKKRKRRKAVVSGYEVANAAFDKLPQLGLSFEELAALLKEDLKLLGEMELTLMVDRENFRKNNK